MPDAFRLTLTLLGVLALLASTLHAAVTPGSYLKTYTSTVDGSVQPYGLYIPTPFNENMPHPVVFQGHGFNGYASGSFYYTQQSFADVNGALIVQLDGRGNTFYDGLGEVDMRDVLKELHAAYLIDDSRLYFEGVSMGATGAYRQGIRHPDLLAAVGACDGWGDYRSWHLQYYAPSRDPSSVEPTRVPNLLMDSAMDVAENAVTQNMYMIVDTQDTSVWPENTERLDARLTALGNDTPEPADYNHEVHAYNAGHASNYYSSLSAIYGYFISGGASMVRPEKPAHVMVKTTRLKYGTQFWVTVDRMFRSNEFAVADARVTDNTVAVATSNVRELTVRLLDAPVNAAQPVTVTLDGQTIYTGAAKTLTLYAALTPFGAVGGWTQTDPTPGVLHKTAAMEGPIGDAYCAKFIVAYGASGTAAETAANLAEANNFITRWNAWMHAGISARTDASLTADEKATCNLILFGTADSNSILAALQPRLPITVKRTGITYHGQTYSGPQYGVYYACPNPDAPSRYVVVNHLIVPGATSKDLEALPWYWPDYVIFDATRSAGACVQASLAYLPDTFVKAGYFTETWGANAAPTAVNDSYIVAQNTARTIAAPGVLANDTDAENDTLSAMVTTAPTHGTLALNANGGFTYTPADGYHGQDSFTYTASDGAAVSYQAVVTLTVDGAPVAVTDRYATPVDTALDVPAPGVLVNDTDPDGDPLTTPLAAAPIYGTLTLRADGSFHFVPAVHYTGTDRFAYQASDGIRLSNVAYVYITTSAAQAPTANSNRYATPASVTLRVAAPGVLADDTDPRQTPLTATLVSRPSHGSLDLLADGSFVYRPRRNYAGIDRFIYKASNGRLFSAPADVWVTMTPVNRPPVANDNLYFTLRDTPLAIAAPGILANDRDPDGDPLKPVLIRGALHGTVAVSLDGSFIYTPASGRLGIDSFIYMVYDGKTFSNQATVRIATVPTFSCLFNNNPSR